MTSTSTIHLSFRERSEIFLNHKYVFITIAAACLAISMMWGAAGYLLGIAAVLITAWANRWTISIFGLKRTNIVKDFFIALFISAGLMLLVDGMIQPIVEFYFGEINLDSFDAIKGNFPSFIIFLVVMWISAAFGEEIFYRGYLMKGIARCLGNREESWFLAALISGVYFGFAHLYQGTSGVITTGIIGFLMGIIFMSRRNLWLLVLVHGIYDTIGITLLYLGKETWIADLFNF